MRTVALALALAAAPPAWASPVVVADMATGRVSYAREAEVPWHPASLTKLMTAYVALGAVAAGRVAPDARVTVTPAARALPPSRSGLPAGAALSLGDALRVLMVKSANDIALSVAVAVSGDAASFVAAMNSEAARLGMSATTWRNPHGLHDPGQVTTARDMAVLAAALARDFPSAAPLFSIPAISLDGAVTPNHNNAVGRYPEADGMKTGYVCASGFNVVATASRGGRRMVAVVLGQGTAMRRDELATRLLQAGLATPPGADTLDAHAGRSRPQPPARTCATRPEPQTPAEAAATRAFAAIRRDLSAPYAIRSIPAGTAPVAVAPPVVAAAPAPARPAPPTPTAVLAPAVARPAVPLAAPAVVSAPAVPRRF